MADINTTYAGTIDWQDPDVVIARVPKFPFGSKDLFLPDEIREQIRKQNADAVSTTDAVKVPYTGSTTADRIQWLNDRITATNTRYAFIKARCTQLVDTLQARGADTYDSVVKAYTTALSLVPVVGSVISFVTGKADAVAKLEDYKLQVLLQDYTKDLGQLAQIRSQLVADLAKANTSTTPPPNGPKDPTQKAPTTIPTWYYYAGAGFLLLFFLWLRNRKQRKR